MPPAQSASSMPPRLKDKLAARSFVLTAEISPPVSGDASALLAKALPLAGLADAVNLTDGASARSHMCALAAAALLVQHGIDAIMQITARDRNRIAIQSDLMGAAALGIRNVLFLSGDPPTVGDQPDAKGVFDLTTVAMMDTLRRMRDEGTLPSGRAVTGGLDEFLIGAADMPVDPAPGWEPKGLMAKVAAGAQFAQTQFCMDTGIARRYAARLAELGVTERMGLIIGVVPLRSAKSAAWIRSNLFGSIVPEAMIGRMENAIDPAAEGRRICIEVIEELSTIPGIAGAHIMSPGNDVAAVEVLRAIRGSRI